MDLLIFDLDGTLIDSKLDLAISVNAALGHLGREALPNEEVFSYVGNGAPVLLRRSLGEDATDDEVRQALQFFMEFYRNHMLVNTKLYPGVREALDVFRAEGVQMAVLTNKPEKISQAIIDGIGLGEHFFRVYGGNSFEQKKPDPVGINSLLEEAGASRENTLMVGDSAVDVQTARNARIPVCGVTYGIQPESLETDPPDFFVDSLMELVPLVLDRRKTA